MEPWRNVILSRAPQKVGMTAQYGAPGVPAAAPLLMHAGH